MTSVPGIFAAGNVVHVYDLVDWVTEAGFVAGRGAAQYASKGKAAQVDHLSLNAGENIRYVVPHTIDRESLKNEPTRLQLRVTRPIEERVRLTVEDEQGNVLAKKAEPYARPGEIITMEIKPDAFDMVQKAGELKVHLKVRSVQE
jgi:hypothetical protein